MRLVADLVRGRSVNEAISILKFTPRSAARPVLKAIQSAVANMVNREDSRDVNPDELVVRTIFVDEGPSMRRFLPRAMGRATPVRKRMSHLTVAVDIPSAEPAEEVAPAGEPAAAETVEAPPKKVARPKKKPVRAAPKAKPKKKPAKPAAKRTVKKK
jgi:large subunit ribosomal protein L22